MDKYKLLINHIKDEFLESVNIPYGSCDNPGNKDISKIEKYFEISRDQIEINRANRIFEYVITDRESGQRWRFIVGTAMLLFSRQMLRYRESLVNEESIRGIFTIKSGFFKEAAIPAVVIILDKESGKTWLSSVGTVDDIIKLISSPEQYDRKVYYTAELDAENFMPEHYNGELKKINSALEAFDSRKLEEIADIISARGIPGYMLSPSGIPYLRGRDIQEGKILKSDMHVSAEVAGKYGKQLLQEGDIVLYKFFGQHKIAKVTVDDLPAIASNGLIIIRAYGVSEEYLFRYLTSSTGKAIFDRQLTNIEKGTTVRMINIKELKELKVPMFGEKMMHTLSDEGTPDVNIMLSELARMSRLTKYCEKITKATDSLKIKSESKLEQEAVQAFIDVGWSHVELGAGCKKFRIKLGDKLFIPDIMLFDGDDVIAVVEVKSFIGQLAERIQVYKQIIQDGSVPFLILTTCNYYEIHSVNNKIVRKMTEAPTKEYLLSLLDGKED